MQAWRFLIGQTRTVTTCLRTRSKLGCTAHLISSSNTAIGCLDGRRISFDHPLYSGRPVREAIVCKGDDLLPACCGGFSRHPRGLRVRLDARLLAMIHGCTGPLVFALAGAVIVIMSPWWIRHEQEQGRLRYTMEEAESRNPRSWLTFFAVLMTILSAVQLFLGASSDTLFQLRLLFSSCP